jgi:hypothetical protein
VRYDTGLDDRCREIATLALQLRVFRVPSPADTAAEDTVPKGPTSPA